MNGSVRLLALFSLLYVIVFQKESHAHILLKCAWRCCCCCFFFFTSISCFVAVKASLLTQKLRFCTSQQQQQRHLSGEWESFPLPNAGQVAHRPSCKRVGPQTAQSMVWPEKSWRTSQRPVTSGWRNSTCDLCCRPPAAACFLFYTDLQFSSNSSVCPKATSTMTSVNV